MRKLKLFLDAKAANTPPRGISKASRVIFSVLTLLLLSIGQMWAVDPVTVPLSISDYATANSWVNETVYSSVTIDANVTASVSSGSNTGKYYSSNHSWRVYESESGTITISTTSGTLSSVTFTYGKNNNGVILDGTTQVATGSVYDISGTSKTFSVGHSSGTKNGNVQIQSISVTYTPAGGSTPTLTGVTVSGTPTKKEYSAGDNFDPAGLTVTGTYSDASPAPITSGITWSYNPSQTLVKDQTSIGVVATVSSIASAEYNVTGLTVTAASPKITITQNEVADFAATYAQYTWTAGGVSGKLYAYKNAGMQFNPSKTGYYVYNTDPIPGRITKITMTKASGTDRSWTPYVSTTAMTSASGTALDAQTVTTSGASWDVTGSNSYFYLTVSGGATVIGSIVIEYTEDAPPAIDAPSISGDVNFVGSTTVTISHEDADHIYYTTNGDAPTTSSTEYTAPFVVNADGTTTVKAIAVKGSDVSEVASKGFTKVTALESLAALLEATTSSETAFNVVIDNWVVTGVNGNRAWIADAANEKGILLYKSGHGFTVGKKLNGVVIGTKTKLFQGYPELTSLVSTDVTVTTAEAITPRTTTIAALTSGHPAEQGTVVKLEDVTYTSSALSDGENSIAADNKLFSSLALVDGTTYDIIGVVEYENGGVVKIMPRSIDDVVAKSAVVTPTAANLAALKAAERGTYILTLTNAVVTYVNGKNVFVEEESTGVLVRLDSHNFEAGNCLNGDYQVTTEDYQGKFEITAIEPQAGAATTTAEIPLTTVSIATLNASFGSYESRRVKIVGANVTDAISGDDRNGAINDGAAVAVYAAAGKNVITLTADDNVDIIGYPGFYNTDQQLNVWRQEDITVNVKEDPELAYNPTVVNVLLSDLASFTPADLEYATGFDGVAAITYESSDPSIATVGETTGVVEVVATAEGSATITATFGGNSTYKADNASYTINVSAAPIAPVYTMSFDLTRASYDDAADAQVVWNSNVVTMTADKNDGTKVTNYLAGNYTGTTLIAETRLYAKNSISFVPQEGVSITKIEWMSTAKGYATNLAAETFVNATAAVDGTDDKLVIITPSAAGEISVTLTAPARATAVTVYYEAESEKAKLDASIAIANINTAVGDDDILLSNIAATSNPNKKAISYAITSGAAVSIVGEGKDAAFHALAEGTATITATIPDNLGNYTGATTTFDIVVAAAPATLVSIAISGEATALEYTEGQDFNPAGLVVTGTYSDASTAPISDGITWAFDPSPLTVGTTSVSVTATVSEITSAAFPVNGLTVSAAPVPTSGNIVILAEYNSKFYAMTNSLTSGALAGVEVEKDGSKIVVSSAEDKAAIQWTATVDGDNTTLKDGDDYYIKGSSGASLSLEADPYNWNWDGEKSCYISSAYTNRGLFFSNSGNVFKGYALSNITSDGYAATEIIEIDPEDIVISSKVDPALAYTPASDEITVGDAWSAPVLGYVEGFDGLAAITYESSNEAVATVSDAGVISLAGGTGTATITASFAGNANYLLGSATYTIKVNEPAESCDGTDDFLDTEDKGNPTSYKDRSTPNGWAAVNAGYKVIDEKAYWMINGKTTAVGVITSPELSDGIGSLKFRYANTNSESNGVSVKIEIKQGGDVVKEYTLTKPNSEVVQNTVYTELIENINVEGTFQIVITNLSPSNNTGNKDRVSIGRFCWTGYTAPEPQYVTVRENLDANRYYTICLEKNITDFKGATFWNLTYKNEGNTEVYLVEADQLEAGKPYIFQATGDNEGKLEVMYGSEEANAPVENGALRGTFEDIDVTEFANLEGTVYLLINNAIRPRTSGNYLNAHRAYVRYDLLTVPQTQNFAPGKRVRAIPMQQNTATGIDELNGSEAPTKVLINGQLFILRGEKMYDVKGQLVK